MITVLFVDDEPDFRKPTAALLRQHGFKVIEAGSGADALSRLSEGGSFDLILLDLLMGDTTYDPYGIITKVRQKTHIPIIVLTAFALKESNRISLSMPIDDYQAKIATGTEISSKSVDIGELVARIIKRTRAAAMYDFLEDDDDPASGFWRLNTLNLDLEKPDGAVEKLRPAVYELLLLFLKNPAKRMDATDMKMDAATLRNTLWKLRKIVGRDKVVTIKGAYRFARMVTPV